MPELPICLKIKCEGLLAPCVIYFDYQNEDDHLQVYASFHKKEPTFIDSHVRAHGHPNSFAIPVECDPLTGKKSPIFTDKMIYVTLKSQ